MISRCYGNVNKIPVIFGLLPQKSLTSSVKSLIYHGISGKSSGNVGNQVIGGVQKLCHGFSK
jgi:hypothetical protein